MLSIKDKEALEKSIAHWKRMIEFVEKTGVFYEDKVYIGIGETYNSSFCSLCEVNRQDEQIICHTCVLAENHVRCDFPGSAWRNVSDARTAIDWIIAASGMLDILQGILEGKTFKIFSDEGYDQFGFNREGYNREGYDEEGFNQKGFNQFGFNRQGLIQKECDCNEDEKECDCNEDEVEY